MKLSYLIQKKVSEIFSKEDDENFNKVMDEYAEAQKNLEKSFKDFLKKEQVLSSMRNVSAPAYKLLYWFKRKVFFKEKYVNVSNRARPAETLQRMGTNMRLWGRVLRRKRSLSVPSSPSASRQNFSTTRDRRYFRNGFRRRSGSFNKRIFKK